METPPPGPIAGAGVDGDELFIRVRAALAERYVIERELGRGGMAVVYLARDLRLDRQVAVKVMLPEIAGSVSRDRFLREVKIAAHLNHPNIIPVHDAGDADGLLFYVMAYVDGESLRDRLLREGQLGLADIVTLAREIADALGTAHSQGIVHRDVKPENVMISGGHALVADFGIARAVSAEGEGRITETGVAIGTPYYMSPEQWSTTGQIDGRADQYSLACMVYEMMVGEPPFTGPTPQVVLARHSMEALPSIRIARSAVNPTMEAAVSRAMAKVPADRFATVQQFTDALAGSMTSPGFEAPVLPRGSRTSLPLASRLPGRRTLVRTAAVVGAGVLVLAAWLAWRRFADRPVAPPRVAVLPFRNLGSDEQEYFVDGVTEEVTGRLASIDRIGVIARTSTTQYKNSEKSIRQIGDELGVAYVVEGSIRWERAKDVGGKIRVSSRLILVTDDVPLWSEEFDVELSEVFAVQSQIAERVAGALNVVLVEPERQRLASVPTRDLEAYDYFLRGNALYNRSWARADVEGAIAMYRRAVERDPNFAQAFAQLGRAHAWLHRLGYDATEERLVLARTAADSALALEPDLPEGHNALALYHYWGRWDYDRAIEELIKARDLRPGVAGVHLNIGNVRRRQGQFDSALAGYRRAAELDPRYHIVWYNLGETLLFTRRYEEALAALDRALPLAPDFLDTFIQRATLFVAWRGDVEAARRELDRAFERVPPTQWRPALRGTWMLGLMRSVFPRDQALQRLAPGTYGLDSAGYYLARAEVLARGTTAVDARAVWDSARVLLERQRDRQPQVANVHAELGLAYAGVQRREDALRESQLAVALLPLTRDAFDGPDLLVAQARVHLMLGDRAAAIQHLTGALSVPSRVSAEFLDRDPVWGPLRGDPGFVDLLDRARRGRLTSTP